MVVLTGVGGVEVWDGVVSESGKEERKGEKERYGVLRTYRWNQERG